MKKSLFFIMIFLIFSLFSAQAQTAVVTVPGTATGGFGSPGAGTLNVGYIPLVRAFTTTRPGTITISYVRGLVNYGGPGPVVDPNGGNWGNSPNSVRWALPLDEAAGITSAGYPGQRVLHLGALIGAFIPQSRVNVAGFQAVDNSKGLAASGILPNELFFVGKYHVLDVGGPGVLFLGINDSYAADNSGSFVVNITSP